MPTIIGTVGFGSVQEEGNFSDTNAETIDISSYDFCGRQTIGPVKVPGSNLDKLKTRRKRKRTPNCLGDALACALLPFQSCCGVTRNPADMEPIEVPTHLLTTLEAFPLRAGADSLQLKAFPRQQRQTHEVKIWHQSLIREVKQPEVTIPNATEKQPEELVPLI